MDLLRLLVGAAIVSLPFGQASRFIIRNDVAVTLTDLLVAASCFYWVIVLCFRRITWPHVGLQKYILLLVIILFVSLIANAWQFELNELFSGSLYLFRWLFYSSLYFIVKGFDEKYKKKVVYLLCFAGSLFIFFGYVQYIFYPDLRNLIYLGWDDHLFRLFSTVFDPNFAAVLINLFLFLVGGMIIAHQNKQSRFFTVYFFLFLFGSIALLLTYSRSGYLMFAAGMLTLLILSGKKKFAFFLVLIILGAIVFLPKNLPSEGVNLLRTASIESRFESIQRALILIKNNFFFGVGFNMYRYAQERYGLIPSSRFPYMHSASGTDNSLLFVLATAGIAGFFAYLLLWIKTVLFAVGDFQKRDTTQIKKYLSLVLVGSIAGLFVNSLFLNSLFYPSVMLWMWVLVAITERT